MTTSNTAALPAQWREIALRQVEHALHGLKEWRATYPHILATSVIAATADLRDAADLLRNAARQAQGETTCPTCTDQETPKRGSFLYSNCYGHANGPHPKDCYSCFHESKRQAANAEEEPPAPTSPRLTVVGNGAIAQSIAAAIGDAAPAPTGDRALWHKLIDELEAEVRRIDSIQPPPFKTRFLVPSLNVVMWIEKARKALPALPVAAPSPATCQHGVKCSLCGGLPVPAPPAAPSARSDTYADGRDTRCECEVYQTCQHCVRGVY